jgi:hypothetical protein
VLRGYVEIGKRNVVFDTVTARQGDFDHIPNICTQNRIPGAINTAADADVYELAINHASGEPIFHNLPLIDILCDIATSGEYHC